MSSLLSLAFLSPSVSDDSTLPQDDEPLVDYGTKAGEDWLTGWNYRKSHTMAEATGAGVDYQVSLQVSYDTITDRFREYYDLSARWTTITGDPTGRHAFQVVHTTRIQEVNKVVDGASRKYLAYDSDSTGAEIRLYYTDDFSGTWTAYSGNPILGASNFHYRWPSVALVSGTFHMFLTDRTDLNLERWTSTDGITFNFAETVLNGGDQYKSPFIWLNPNDSDYYLYYHDSAGADEMVKVKVASDITALAAASVTTVLTETGAFGAPSIMYKDGRYWLMTEYQSGTWFTVPYVSANPDSGFVSVGDILINDEACAMQFLSPDGLRAYLFSNRDSALNTWYQDTREIFVQRTVSVETNSMTDFGDIRFTDDDGITELSYWIQEKVNSDYAIFWIEIADSLESASQTFYLYYGNPGSTTTSNGDSTFRFFDDFSDASLDWANKWQSTDQTKYSIESGELKCGAITVLTTLLNTKSSFSGFAVEAMIRSSVTATDFYFTSELDVATYTGKDRAVITRSGLDQLTIRLDSVNVATAEPEDLTQYYRVVYLNPAAGSSSITLYKDEVEQLINLRPPAERTVYLSFLAHTGAAIGYVDDVFVRKYVFLEPAHGAWGSEERQHHPSGGATLIGIGATFDYIVISDIMGDDTVEFRPEPIGRFDNSTISYYWEFSDGDTSNEVNPTKTFEYGGITGDFTASLTICNERYCSHPVERDIHLIRWWLIVLILAAIITPIILGMRYIDRKR